MSPAVEAPTRVAHRAAALARSSSRFAWTAVLMIAVSWVLRRAVRNTSVSRPVSASAAPRGTGMIARFGAMSSRR